MSATELIPSSRRPDFAEWLPKGAFPSSLSDGLDRAFEVSSERRTPGIRSAGPRFHRGRARTVLTRAN